MLIQVKQGKIKRGDIIVSSAFERKYDVFEVNIKYYLNTLNANL